MPEQEKNLYNLEQAKLESDKIREKADEISGGEKVEKEDYEEAEREVSKEVLKMGKQRELEADFSNGWLRDAQEVINFAKKNNIELNLTQACETGLRRALSEGRIVVVERIINFAEKNKVEINLACVCKGALKRALSGSLVAKIDKAERVLDFAEKNKVEVNITYACQEALKEILYYKGRDQTERIEKIISFAKENNIQFNEETGLNLIEAGMEKTVDKNIDLFQGEFFDKYKEFNLYPSEAYYINDFDKIDNLDDLEKEQYQDWFNNLKEKNQAWQDEENISGPFEVGGEYFGYDKMFKYIGQENRHDVLYNFEKITELAKQSSLKPEQFYVQILSQIKMDDSQYGEEENPLKSFEYLNQIVNAVDDIEQNKEDIKEYVEELKEEEMESHELISQIESYLDDKKNIFTDWKNLKNYYELLQTLGDREFRDAVRELSPKGRKYAQKLIAHPNIDTQKVVQFCKDPEEFLDIGEIHSEESHKRKKPSNYVEIPHLDLTAENLRDGLVEGDLDKLQDWQSLEIEYQLPENLSEKPKSLRYNLAKSLGVKDEEIRRSVGISQDEKLKRDGKLFSKLNKKFKSAGLNLVEYLKGKQEIPKKLEQELEEFKGDEQISTVEYRAKINLKSDPDGVVAGNDTACCMPFGSGKNNVYTFNPVCALFTVQRKTGDKWRTVAQSVLTKDIDIKKNVAEIIEQIENERVKLDSIVSEDVLLESDNIITCDNIEVAPNFKEHQDKNKVLEYIYKDFFQEYIKKFGEQEKLDKERAIIGKGYTDAITHLDNIDNTFVPIAPVGYSDNLGDQALELKLSDKQTKLALKRKVLAQEKPLRQDLVKSKTKGVENLTFKDSLQVAYLEGKAYHDNESLMEYLHNMENALIAKDINNVAKNRPNLSLKYVDDKKRMQGYILAYEGKSNGEKVIYVSDLAADPKAKLAGGRLIKEFTQAYKEHYLDKDNFIPILAEAREKTSYAIIVKQLDKISKDLGIEFEIEELDKEEKEGDVMRLVLIRPRNKV